MFFRKTDFRMFDECVKGSLSHGDTLSGLGIVADSSHCTYKIKLVDIIYYFIKKDSKIIKPK